MKKEFRPSWYIIIYKLFYGILEAGTGIITFFWGNRLLLSLTKKIAVELAEDPHDLLANITNRIMPHTFSHDGLIIFYLIILGLAKIAGAIGLIKRQNWGVDLLVGLTVLMFPFQVVDLILHFSLFKLLYIFVGLAIALYLVEFDPKAWVSRILQKPLFK